MEVFCKAQAVLLKLANSGIQNFKCIKKLAFPNHVDLLVKLLHYTRYI